MTEQPHQNSHRFSDKNSVRFPDIAFPTRKSGEAVAGMVPPISPNALTSRLLIIPNSENTPLDGNKKEARPKKPKQTTSSKKITYKNTITSQSGRLYLINQGKVPEKPQGVYALQMERLIGQFEISLNKWRRVFVLRFDLHQEFYSNDNKHVSKFWDRLSKKLRRVYGFDDMGFCWAREQERSKSQHYHWVLYLDGNLIRHSSKIRGIITKAWERPCGGYSVYHAKEPYFVDAEEKARDAIHRISYLAKTRGKGYRPNQTKDYGCSRMRPTTANGGYRGHSLSSSQ